MACGAPVWPDEDDHVFWIGGFGMTIEARMARADAVGLYCELQKRVKELEQK
jgi:hypothetical protein